MSTKETKNEVATVTSQELSLVENNILNTRQLGLITSKTPAKYLKERPAKGGGKWTYVTGGYIKKVLNLMFGWDWDFRIVEHKFDLQIGQAYVLGELKCRITRQDGTVKEVVKMQFGRVDIKFKNEWVPDGKGGTRKQQTDQPLDIGNDLKAASTDALKKCASELGIASDIYGAEEFKELHIAQANTCEEKAERIRFMLDADGLIIAEDERLNIERILDQEEAKSYDKAIKLLLQSMPKIK
jgi:hypothetical protein